MRPRRFVPVIAAVAVAGLATLGCAEQSAAVRVGDRTVSESDLISELDAYGDNEALFASGASADSLRGDLSDSYDQQFVAEIIQQRIVFLLAEGLFEDEGLELDDGARSQAEQTLASQFGGGFDDFPEEYRDAFVEDVARYYALVDEMGADGFDEALLEAAGRETIVVSSRFGEWDAQQFAVVSPAGSTPMTDDTAIPTEDPAADVEAPAEPDASGDAG